MTRKRWLSLPLTLLGFGPYLLKLPYILKAWQTSPLDRPDLLFLILAGLMATVLLLGSWKRAEPQWQNSALFLVAPALALFAWSFPLDINLLGIVSALILAWAMIWWIYGWRGAWQAFPMIATLLLTCTSSHYWLSYALADYAINGLALKIFIAAIMVILMTLNGIFNFSIRPASFFFCILSLLTLLIYLLANTLTQGPPFKPELSDGKYGEYLGRKTPLNEADLRFFRESQLEKYQFADKKSAIDVLVVNCQDNIHQIHPASHCLRSSGWKILNEKISSVIIQNKSIPLSEIHAIGGSRRILLWAWYSNSQLSTGGFLGFRRFWHPHQGWRHYQLSTSAGADLEIARNELQRFLNQDK